MPKSRALENAVLRGVLQNTAFPFAGDAAVFIALHSSDPGKTGTQATSEITYTGYARVAVNRDDPSWTEDLVNGIISNASEIQFPTCTGGTATATHFSVGRQATGPGDIHYYAPLPAPLSISNAIRPIVEIGQLQIDED